MVTNRNLDHLIWDWGENNISQAAARDGNRMDILDIVPPSFVLYSCTDAQHTNAQHNDAQHQDAQPTNAQPV